MIRVAWLPLVLLASCIYDTSRSADQSRGDRPADQSRGDRPADQSRGDRPVADLLPTDLSRLDQRQTDGGWRDVLPSDKPIGDLPPMQIVWSAGSSCGSSKPVAGGLACSSGLHGVSSDCSLTKVDFWCDAGLSSYVGCLNRGTLSCMPSLTTNQVVANATCSGTLVGGGCRCLSSELKESFPDPSAANTWQCRCTQADAVAWAVCLSQSPWKVRSATNKCGGPEWAIGGGCSCTTTLVKSQPSNTGSPSYWDCLCTGGGTDGGTETTYTLCAQ
jgi:hypothetical protein